MNTQLATRESGSLPAMQMSEPELMSVLQSSLYPGAALDSIKMVLGYCKASGLDPMQKPVHIVPMWDGKAKQMRDVVMPGIGLYRTQAARSNAYGGITEPEFGPDVTETMGSVEITYPQWCRVTVKRRLPDGSVADFTAVERWKENYATGGRDSTAPNAMWKKRPYGQLAKCAQAQALRMAFPEIGSMATAEEMEGKLIDDGMVMESDQPRVSLPKAKAESATTVEPRTPAAAAPAATTSAPKPVNAGQLKWIENKCKALGLEVETVITEQGGESLDTLTPEQFDAVKNYLMAA